MSSVLLDPRVIDVSNVSPRVAQPIYLPIGIEGVAAGTGDATVGQLYPINRVDEAETKFGAASSLTLLITQILDQGAGPVVAVASAKGTSPDLAARQTAWQALESDENVRIRLTDSETQAELAELGISAANADKVTNKQVAICGMPSGTESADLIAAATAIAADAGAATRTALVAPGVYDLSGTLRGGSFAAAAVACEIAKNADPSNDLDLTVIPLLTGIEVDATGLPIFRRKVISGTASDDYEELLQGGVSPLQPSRVAGGVMTTHLRTVYTTSGAWDNFYTRIIVDQVFLDVKEYILDNNFLRQGNLATVQAKIKSGVAAVLLERNSWIQPITEADGSQGYGVTVSPSEDQRQITVGYRGIVTRGISIVNVAANLTIPS